MPRKFRLFEELEKGEKGLGDQSISYGLESSTNSIKKSFKYLQEEDMTLSNWNGTIVGPMGVILKNRKSWKIY
jgi:ubiquitin-conjugating enzyme E2 variant